MLRNFLPEDESDYIALSEAFYKTDACLSSVPRENFEDTFDLIMAKSPFVRGLIFDDDGERAGYALLSFTYSNEAGGLVVWLEEVYIKPEFQGRGLGSELFAFLSEQYSGVATRIRLEVVPGNTRAISLYKRLGFKELGYIELAKDESITE